MEDYLCGYGRWKHTLWRRNTLLNLGIEEEAREALDVYGYSLDEVLEVAEEPGLGNGGLGRLAAC